MAVRRKHIRALVGQILHTHGLHTRPVDVMALAAALGAQIHDDVVADDLSGFLVRDVNSRRALIGVNGAHSEVRRRFTVAHELGHLLLHDGDQLHVDRREGVTLGPQVRLRNYTSSLGVDEEEKEANAFAAELLMPYAWLTEDISAPEGDAPRDEDEGIIGWLAGRYGVSVQAMTFRLTNLGLIH